MKHMRKLSRTLKEFYRQQWIFLKHNVIIWKNWNNFVRSSVSRGTWLEAITQFWHSPACPIFFSSDHTETSKYQNVHMSAQQKWLGFAIFLFFKACQREIIKYSCYWSPCKVNKKAYKPRSCTCLKLWSSDPLILGWILELLEQLA